MPSLYRYIDKDGYYIKGAIPGSGQISTLQVTNEALRRIRAVIGKDQGPFPHYLLRQLLDEKLVFTKGEHPHERIPALSISRTADSARPCATAVLGLIDKTGSWGLAIQVKEIPRAWSSAVDSLVDALSEWELVSEASKVPATQLWPGRGGAQLPVMPHHEAYNVRPVGKWPTSWDVAGWLGSVPGLSSNITVFSGEGGERLSPGLPLETGESYFLVAPANVSAGDGQWPPPSFLDSERLGVRDEWQAWSIQLPESADIYLSAWCDAIGYRLAQPRYRLSLITPPHRYSDQGAPVVFAEREIVFGLSPIGDSAETDDETSFYTARFQEPGMYRVALDDISTGPLHIFAERRAVVQPESPAALAIDLELYGEKVTYHAFKDSVGPHALNAFEKLPSITVHCPVPLDRSWSLRATKGQIEGESAEEAGARVSEQIAEAVRRKENLTIQLDAGAYGRLQLEYVVRSIPGVDGLSLPLAAVRRARWLAAALRDGQHIDTLVPLSSIDRRKLAHLSTLQGCAALRELRAAPASLIPHLHAITRLVQD